MCSVVQVVFCRTRLEISWGSLLCPVRAKVWRCVGHCNVLELCPGVLAQAAQVQWQVWQSSGRGQLGQVLTVVLWSLLSCGRASSWTSMILMGAFQFWIFYDSIIHLPTDHWDCCDGGVLVCAWVLLIFNELWPPPQNSCEDRERSEGGQQIWNQLSALLFG